MLRSLTWREAENHTECYYIMWYISMWIKTSPQFSMVITVWQKCIDKIYSLAKTQFVCTYSFTLNFLYLYHTHNVVIWCILYKSCFHGSQPYTAQFDREYIDHNKAHEHVYHVLFDRGKWPEWKVNSYYMILQIIKTRSTHSRSTLCYCCNVIVSWTMPRYGLLTLN